MNVYRVTIVLSVEDKLDRYHTKWLEAKNMKQLKKRILPKLEKSKWKLSSIHFERHATYVEPEWQKKYNKTY